MVELATNMVHIEQKLIHLTIEPAPLGIESNITTIETAERIWV